MIIRIRILIPFIWLFAIVLSKSTILHTNTNVSIAIIGAGIAGLSAARRLNELGYGDVTIFESTSRIGGRVYAIEFEDGYLQLGAQYINGDRNPIYSMANELELIEESFDDEAFMDIGTFATGDCDLNSEEIFQFREFTAPLEDKYAAMSEKAKNHSIGQLYAVDYAEFIKDKLRKKAKFDALSRFYRSYYEIEWAADWNNLALLNWEKWSDYSDDRTSFTMNRLGYTGILNYLRKTIGSTNIRLNSGVINVDYGKTMGPIVLTLVDGTKHPFAHVIITVSLGHLKGYARKMFTPMLPRKKLEAIDKMGFGHMSKVFLIYQNQTFLSPNIQCLVPLTIDNCNGLTLSSSKLSQHLHTFQPLEWHSNVLVAWLSGESAQLVDRMSDEEISEQFTQHLRIMLKNPDIPPPYRIVRTHWSTDDSFLGSYSYITIDAASLPDSAQSRLAAPVYKGGQLKLFFAGEATHERIYQTVIGAYLSGRREADRLDSYCHKRCSSN